MVRVPAFGRIDKAVVNPEPPSCTRNRRPTWRPSMSAGVALLEVCPPTVVEHCVAASLTGGTDLVVARVTTIELYTLQEQHAPAVPAKGKPAKGGQALDGIASAQLRFVARLALNGAVASMRAVSSSPGAPKDRLLIAFAPAKLALLDYDSESNALRTIAAHSFDALGEREVGCYEAGKPPLLRAHPGGSTAALLAYGTQLLLMPLIGSAALGGGGGPLPAVPPLAASPASHKTGA